MGCPWKERFEAVTSSRTQPHLACTAIFRCLREELRSHGESRIYGSSGVCDNPVTQKTFRHNSIRPEPQGCESRMGLPVALSLAFPASTQQRRKPLQCHRFPRAREGLLARETISPADNLPKHQSGRAFTKRLLPQASSVASRLRCALSRSGTASFPVLPFQTNACPLLRFVRSSFSPECV